MGRLYARGTAWGFLALPLLVYMAVVLIPILSTFYFSLTDWDILGEANFIGLDNYIRMFGDPNFRLALNNNIIYLGINLLEIPIALFLAISLVEIGKKFSTYVKTIYFIPCIISSIAIAETVRRMVALVPQGVINSFLELVGLAHLQSAFAGMPDTALYVVALADVYRWTALYMVIYYTALISIPNELIEAAKIDGANGFRTYIHIRLPMIRDIIVTTAILITTGVLKVFEMPFILTGGGPGFSSQVLATYMYLVSFDNLQFGYGSAISIFQAALSMAAVVFLRIVFFKKKDI